MSSKNDLALVSMAMIDESTPNTNYYIEPDGSTVIEPLYSPASGSYKKLLVKFEDIPSDILSCYLNYIYIFFGYAQGGIPVPINIRVLSEKFDPETVTWNTRPGVFSWGESYFSTSQWVNGNLNARISDADEQWDKLKAIAEYGVEIYYMGGGSSSHPGIRVIRASIIYDPIEANIVISSPQNGSYCAKNLPNQFAWVIESNAVDGNPPIEYHPKQTSAIFKWRINSEGTIHTVNAGTSLSVTIPAGTFTTDTIQWCVTATLSTGDTFTTDWITVSTVDTVPSTTLQSPKNSILDGSTDCTFTWNHIISTGSAQTAFDLQISQDNATWTTLRSMTTSETSVVIPANTLTGGDLYWRVRTYNTDGVAGEWSESAHCIVVAAPDTPLISIVDSAPRFSIRWQQSGQQGYEIMLDGQRIAKKWGETSSYQYDGYLAPGSYDIQVRIQNKYGLWSGWGSAALLITNTEGAAITLYAEVDNVVKLQWSTTEAYDAYLIYRDGRLIGKTQTMTFTDHFALGDVAYTVHGVYNTSGNYTVSNSVSVDAFVNELMIAAVDNPVWITIQTSASSLRTRNHNATKAVTYLHYTGAELPSAEIGEALDKTYRFDVAFKRSAAESAEFESLIGKLVCIKDPDGYRVIGVLESQNMTANPFYKSYSCTVTLTDWQEGADL